MAYGVAIEVSGSRACFTRPELKVERVSYDVITPSAARGILDAIYWHPSIKWVVDRIVVLNEIKTGTIRRNEVKKKGSFVNARKAMYGNDVALSILASEERTQRQTLYLRDVRYLIYAHFEIIDKACRNDLNDEAKKCFNIFLRRVKKGQCFSQPYFGCREFPVEEIKLCDSAKREASFYAGQTINLGYMLYEPGYGNSKPSFFKAVMVDGQIDVSEARKELVG